MLAGVEDFVDVGCTAETVDRSAGDVLSCHQPLLATNQQKIDFKVSHPL